MIFDLELVIIVLGLVLLNVFHHPEFGLPFAIIVVGIHFLPLARVFAVRLYYGIGVLFVLVGVTIMLAVPAGAMIGNRLAWDVLVGSVSALILWLTGRVPSKGNRCLLAVCISRIWDTWTGEASRPDEPLAVTR